LSAKTAELASTASAPSFAPSERLAWDEPLTAAGGHLLQSWRWGAFKALHGWEVERVRVETDAGVAQAQVLFRHRGPVGLGYLPRGPAFTADDPALAERLFAEVDRVAQRRGAINLIVEPDRPLPFVGRYRDAGFVRGGEHIQPGRTVKVPLLEDEALLNQMHQKTRYNVRLAKRRGVVAVRVQPDEAAVSTFYNLLGDTAGRNEFGIHDRRYYDDFLRLFGEDAVLLLALIDNEPVAGVIAARFGDEAVYMYGGSSTVHRAHGAGFYLQFEAMRWAREQGCARYDLWGIPMRDPASTGDGGDRVAGTKGSDWRGLYEFKVRFGGEIVSYPPALERRYRPVLAAVARRLYRPGA
jgi:lipid II:glycine glycyltransferase (peptidoglycan interpeptide bridge formation enzyme)